MKDKNTIRKELTKNFKGFISGKETSKLFVVAGHSSDENRYHIARMLSAIENEEFDGSFDVVVQNDTPNSVFLTIFIEEMGAFYDDITLILCGESCAISMPQVNNCLSSLVFHAPVID